MKYQVYGTRPDGSAVQITIQASGEDEAVREAERSGLTANRVICLSATGKTSLSEFNGANGPRIICPNPNCAYHGPAKKETRGSVGLGILLLLFFILPGILYLALCCKSSLLCPRCNGVIRQGGAGNSNLSGVGNVFWVIVVALVIGAAMLVLFAPR